MARPQVGDMAPNFDLPAAGGKQFKLSDHLGKAVVLYCYPKDDTSGCTKEAIEFTAELPEFEKLGVSIIGISPDGVKKHDKFRDKHQLLVELVADEEKIMLQAYGVWVEKSMYGKKYMGVERSTFLIDKKGVIARVWYKVSVPGHVEEVLEAARTLHSAS